MIDHYLLNFGWQDRCQAEASYQTCMHDLTRTLSLAYDEAKVGLSLPCQRVGMLPSFQEWSPLKYSASTGLRVLCDPLPSEGAHLGRRHSLHLWFHPQRIHCLFGSWTRIGPFLSNVKLVLKAWKVPSSIWQRSEAWFATPNEWWVYRVVWLFLLDKVSTAPTPQEIVQGWSHPDKRIRNGQSLVRKNGSSRTHTDGTNANIRSSKGLLISRFTHFLSETRKRILFGGIQHGFKEESGSEWVSLNFQAFSLSNDGVCFHSASLSLHLGQTGE